MRDIIDERNEKERISRSIVKFWNVNYVPVQEKSENTQSVQELHESVIEEKQPIELSDGLYNKTTKSYSGTYGVDSVEDEVTKGQIDRILQEKDDALRHLLDESVKEDLGKKS